MADTESVRCRKCRNVLITDLDSLLNAHNEKHQGGRGDDGEPGTECIAASERSCLYISEDSYPEFVTDAIDESSWTKGKLNCPGCQARIGSFNYVSGSHCTCGSHIVPQVHLLVSKVDVRRAMEALPNPVSYPDHPVALSSADIQSLPMLISAGSSTSPSNCNSVHALLAEAHQPFDEMNRQTTLHADVKTLLSTDEKCENDVSPSTRTPNASPKKRCDEARHRKLQRQLPNVDNGSLELPIKSSNLNVLALAEGSSDVGGNVKNEDIPTHLTCSVCLDLLYSPFVAQPCSHVFCEPCLRRVAKPDPTKTCCPLCRQIIGQCMLSRELAAEVREKFSELYQERHEFEQKHNNQNTPLPWRRNFRHEQLSPRRGMVEMAGGWQSVLWMVAINIAIFGGLTILKWYLKSLKELENQEMLRHEFELENQEMQGQEFG